MKAVIILKEMMSKKMAKIIRNKLNHSTYPLIFKEYLEFIRFKENNLFLYLTRGIQIGNKFYKYISES
jgi:hypothetical protein